MAFPKAWKDRLFKQKPSCCVYVLFCSKYHESIHYDEYLDGGIPDTLLEGLGFYANSGDAEATNDADEITHERPTPETIQEPQSLAATSSTTGRILSYVQVLCCY